MSNEKEQDNCNTRISICHVQITPINSMPRVWREAESAQKSGMEVTIIGQGDNCVEKGIQYIGFPKETNRIRRMLFESRKMIKAAVKTGADIIQFHSPEFMLSVPYLKRQGKKIIFDSHEFYGMQIKEKSYIPSFLRSPIAKTYMAIEKMICKRIDCVFYPCTLEGRNYFENRARQSEKIENFSSPANIPNHINTNDKYVICAGSLTEERGITILSEAIKLTNAKLVLCGPFHSDDYKEEILSKSEKIIYKGIVARDELFELYAKSSVGVATLLPVGQYTKVDNMSTKVYEYMQCGIPTVLSDFPFWVKLNKEYKFGITVNPSDPEDIARAIQYILDNPIQANKMGDNGKNAVNSVFNWNLEEKKLLSKYKEIMGK